VKTPNPHQYLNGIGQAVPAFGNGIEQAVERMALSARSTILPPMTSPGRITMKSGDPFQEGIKAVSRSLEIPDPII